jgi:hypothetical protein
MVISSPWGAATSQGAVLSVILWMSVNLVPAITLNGGVGASFRIEYVNAVGPTNAWTTLATVTLTNNPQLYFDVSVVGQPARYYRLVQWP